MSFTFDCKWANDSKLNENKNLSQIRGGEIFENFENF